MEDVLGKTLCFPFPAVFVKDLCEFGADGRRWPCAAAVPNMHCNIKRAFVMNIMKKMHKSIG